MVTLDANIWIAVFDPRDSFHSQSAEFLTAVARRQLTTLGPAFVVVETSCAVARRLQDAQAARIVAQRMRTNPMLRLLPLNEQLLALAEQLGARYLVRGGDALYVATAALTGAPLITWDSELITRANAITPLDWLAAQTS